MKLNFTFIFLFFVILLSINTNDFPKNTKNFLNLNSNTVRQIIKSSIDNSLISIVFSFNDDDSSKKYTLQKINMDQSSHRIFYEFDLNDDPIKMVINQNNNLILVVTENKNLLTISQDGELISKIKIENNSNAAILNFEFNQIDDSFYIFFIDHKTDNRTIIKYNPHGKEEWRHELRKGNSFFLGLTSITISYKDQLLFLALEYDSKEYVIYKISFNGELSEFKIKKKSI